MTPAEQSILTKRDHELALARTRSKRFYEKNKASIVKKRQESRKQVGAKLLDARMAEWVRVVFESDDEDEEDEEDEVLPPPKKRKSNKNLEFTLPECENLLRTDPLIIKKGTLSTYISSIRRIFSRTGCKSLRECLQNVPLMLKKLTKLEKNNFVRTQKNTMQVLTIFMTRYGLLDVFQDKATGIAVQDTILRGFANLNYESHEISLKDMEKVVPSFKVYLDKCKTKFKVGSKQYLLSYCYSLFTPRDDFARMRVIKTLGEDDDEHNFILIDQNKVVFILNQYKTHSKYNKIIFEVNNKTLDKLLGSYMEKHKLGYGDYLFGGAEHLSPFIVGMHKDLGYTGVHKNMFRHMRVEDSFKGQHKTAEERIQLANDMQHSAMTSKLYRRNMHIIAQPEIK